MGFVKISPGRLNGCVSPPPSKSLVHRALLCAALAEGQSVIGSERGIRQLSDDIQATLDCVQELGAKVQRSEQGLMVEGRTGFDVLQGSIFGCNESGSTLRFMIPIALVYGGQMRFIGKGNLSTRPLEPYRQICRQQGIDFAQSDGKDLSLELKGKLRGGVFRLPGDVSSQFITGLLMALPLLKESSQIEIIGELESQGYIDLTIDVMKEFGVIVERKGSHKYNVMGNQRYKPCQYNVEADYSQAAFFLAAAALGSQIEVCNLHKASAQGDKAMITVLQDMGAKVVWRQGALKVLAPEQLQAINVNVSQCPDIAPEIALLLAVANGKNVISGATRLRMKECDRLHAIVQELNKMGAKLLEKGDSIHIEGVEKLKGGVEVDSFSDHRMAMMLSVAAAHSEKGAAISDPGCVRKSYPEFFGEFVRLGGQLEWARRLGKI